LTQGQVAIVNEEDYGYLAQWKWFAVFRRGGFIAVRNGPTIDGRRHTIYLSRVIAERMGLDMSKVIDHIDHDTLDNTRDNLRAATCNESARNRRGNASRIIDLPKGVYMQGSKYKAVVQVDKKNHYLGTFDTPAAAASAYDAAALELHGSFACINGEIDDA
jgi:hypothetical protein